MIETLQIFIRENQGACLAFAFLIIALFFLIGAVRNAEEWDDEEDEQKDLMNIDVDFEAITAYEKVQDTPMPNQMDDEMLRLLNASRKQANIPQLLTDGILNEMAHDHLKLMIECKGTIPYPSNYDPENPIVQVVGNVSTTKPTIHATHSGYVATAKMFDRNLTHTGIASEWQGGKLYNVTLFAEYKKEIA